MANLGQDFSISGHMGTPPQQPALVKLWHPLCTNVNAFSLIYLSDGFTAQQVATFAAAPPATRLSATSAVRLPSIAFGAPILDPAGYLDP